MTPAESIALRLTSARKLITQLEPGTPEMIRAAATLAALEAAAKQADGELTIAKLTTRAAAVARSRDAQKRHSTPWIQLDAEFDVLVAIEEDINPTTVEEMGEGSKPLKPAPEAAAETAPAPTV